jgi:hypothetical protein
VPTVYFSLHTLTVLKVEPSLPEDIPQSKTHPYMQIEDTAFYITSGAVWKHSEAKLF